VVAVELYGLTGGDLARGAAPAVHDRTVTVPGGDPMLAQDPYLIVRYTISEGQN
jgi:hypothetical protein